MSTIELLQTLIRAAAKGATVGGRARTTINIAPHLCFDVTILHCNFLWTCTVEHKPLYKPTPGTLQRIKLALDAPTTALWTTFPLLDVITWEDAK